MTAPAAPPDLVPRSAPPSNGPALPHPAPFFCDLAVAPDDMGKTIRHAANTAYVRWLDRAAELHAEQVGYPRELLLARGIMWFVARHEIDYLAEVWPGDRLVVATWVRDIHRVRSWRDYVVHRPSDGREVCRAATLWVLVDLATRRPTRIPDEMVRRFRPLQAAAKVTRCTSR